MLLAPQLDQQPDVGTAASIETAPPIGWRYVVNNGFCEPVVPRTQSDPPATPEGHVGIVCTEGKGGDMCMCPGCATSSECMFSFGVLEHHDSRKKRSSVAGQKRDGPLFDESD